MADQPQKHLAIDRFKTVLEIIATALIIAVAAGLLWRIFVDGRQPMQAARARSGGAPAKSAPTPAPLPTEPLSLSDAAVKGDPKAKIVLIEYSDFQCPYCSKFVRETLPALEKQYIETGKVQVAFRHLPLEPIHSAARSAAEAAECARRQGKFWEMHDRLFAVQPRLVDANFRDFANAVGLDLTVFDTCVNGRASEAVQADAQSARALGISGTPTFFVGLLQSQGRVRIVDRLVGAQSPAGFGKIFDELLKSN